MKVQISLANVREAPHPDLVKSVMRILADDRLESVTAGQIALYMSESVQNTWKALAHLSDHGGFVEAPQGAPCPPHSLRPLRASKWDLRKDLPWRISKRPKQAPLRMKLADQLEPDLALKSSVRCPKCGQPLKGRHSRKEHHNSEKCAVRSVRDIMEG